MCRRKRNHQLWRKNINTVNFGRVICSKHDVSGDGRHESPRIRLKNSCKWKQSLFLMNQEASLKTGSQEKDCGCVKKMVCTSWTSMWHHLIITRRVRIFTGRESASIISRKSLQRENSERYRRQQELLGCLERSRISGK